MGIVLGLAVVFQSLGILIAAVIPVRVMTTEGQTVEGDFAGFGESVLRVNVDDEMQSFAFEDLQSIIPVDANDDATGPNNRVTLMGGSQIAVQDVTVADEKMVLEPRRQPSISVPLWEVRSIRFRAASSATDAQWLGLLEQDARGDLLVIRRANDQLDPASGLVKAIADGVVQFDMDGDTVDAPIEKLEGIVLRSRPSAAKPTLQVADQYGSRFSAVAILPSAADEPIGLKLSDSVTHSIPVRQLQSIFFSGGIQMLAAQKPAQIDFSAYVATNLKDDLQSKWFAPKADDDDIVIHGGGAVEYRVNDKFTKLAGSVRRDQGVDKAGDVTVEIFVDDKSVWKETLTNPQPKGFELPVENARRVRFIANSGPDGDLGDRVRISRPRLLK